MDFGLFSDTMSLLASGIKFLTWVTANVNGGMRWMTRCALVFPLRASGIFPPHSGVGPGYSTGLETIEYVFIEGGGKKAGVAFSEIAGQRGSAWRGTAFFSCLYIEGMVVWMASVHFLVWLCA